MSFKNHEICKTLTVHGSFKPISIDKETFVHDCSLYFRS